MKKSVLGAVFAGMLLASAASQAVVVNVGGVQWDVDSVPGPGTKKDFFSSGSVVETAVNPQAGFTSVSGFGQIEKINGSTNFAYCPSGCELTYTFSMDLVNIGAPDAVTGKIPFEFNNLVINVWLDSVRNYDNFTLSTAYDGTEQLFLQLKSSSLAGSGSNIGTGSDSGDGTALVNVTGGIAAAFFDTNLETGGFDMVFSSSFQPAGYTSGGRDILTGDFQLTGQSTNVVPEPSSLALLGLGLVGLAGLRRKAKSRNA